MVSDIVGVAQPELVDRVFDLAAQERRPGIVVFPAIRTEDQLLDQLRTLQRGERWTLSRVEVDGLVSIELDCCGELRTVRPPCMIRRVRRSGRYCWSCGCRRPNERFSRRSGLRCVCRDCYRVGPAELAYRQALRNVERSLRGSDFIPRRHRKLIERFLEHRDARVCAYAAECIARDAEARRERAEWAREEERAYEEYERQLLEEERAFEDRADRELDDARMLDRQAECELEDGRCSMMSGAEEEGVPF